MSKRRPSIDPGQLGFSFDELVPATRAADLAGLDRVFSAAVGEALKRDPRSREEIAGAMSSLLGEPVTKMMLDAYASEARENHNIPGYRLWALIAATNRLDLLDLLTRKVGAAILDGGRLQTLRRGHLQAELARLRSEIRELDRELRPIEREGKRR